MTGARWTQMWELFHAALEQSPDARADWLATQCADDTALRDELAGLLAAHAAGDSPLDRAPAAELVEPSLPESFGPWQVRREIGQQRSGVAYRLGQRRSLWRW